MNNIKSNKLPDIRYILNGYEGKNYAFDDCMAFIMERLKNTPQFDYWDFTWITGDGLTQIYNKKQTKDRQYCVSGYLAGKDYIKFIFNTIGYDYEYVTSEQINADKKKYIQKIKYFIDINIPVLVMTKMTKPFDDTEFGGYSLFVGYEDDGDKLLYVPNHGDEIRRFDSKNEIHHDWIFIGEKLRDVVYNDIINNAAKKMQYWLTIPERNRVCYGAAAFRAWADDIENGRFDDEPDLWANYGTYFCNMATNSWANNISDAPHASLFYKFAQINPQFFDMRNEIAKQFFRIGNGDGAGGIWKELEDLGGGFNLNNETFRDKEKKTQIAGKLREAANCMEAVERILNEGLF